MTQFGLAIKNFVGPGEVPDVKALYAYAERAEALGFESLWAWDHVLLGVEPSFPIIDSITTLAAIAARTRTIKLGTGVLVLPLRNPVVAAKALGSLDVISGGRLILGVAAGWYAREFDAVGVPFKQRGRIFERNLEILDVAVVTANDAQFFSDHNGVVATLQIENNQEELGTDLFPVH